MKTELQLLSEQLASAASYLDVFGTCDGDTSAQTAHVKRVFRRLARVAHPDTYSAPNDQDAASTAFALLENWHAQAQEALRRGTYGQPIRLATVASRMGKHDITSMLVEGDLAVIYRADTMTPDGGPLPTVLKVARTQRDNDLLETEAAALKRLRGPGTNAAAHPFVTKLVDSFMFREPAKPPRRANVLERLDGFYTLEQLRRAFPSGLNPLHAAWIWRRLLVALYHAHVNHVVHGAVLPGNVLIEPLNHGVVLIDWCYASVGDAKTQPPIKAIVNRYHDWYPQEVLDKGHPSPSTDIALAARCMIELMGGNPITGNLPDSVPRQFRAFFRGCLSPSQSMRPSDALELQREFDALLESMGAPFYPRRFRELIVPTGAV